MNCYYDHSFMAMEDDEEVSAISSKTGVEITTPKKKKKPVSIILQCPPAPTKLKPSPRFVLGKRRSDDCKTKGRLLLDLSDDVQSLFPVGFMADLRRKLKKARTCSSSSEN